MNLKRLSTDIIRATFTSKELEKRNIAVRDIVQQTIKVKELIDEIIDEASRVYNFEVDGFFAIKVNLSEDGVLLLDIINSNSVDIDSFYSSDDDIDEGIDYDDFEDDPVADHCDNDELDTEIEDDEYSSYRFKDIEIVIQLAKRLKGMGYTGGRLYHYTGYYYFCISEFDAFESDLDVYTILTEYADESKVTFSMLEEYGNKICKSNAVGILTKHFK